MNTSSIRSVTSIVLKGGLKRSNKNYAVSAAAVNTATFPTIFPQEESSQYSSTREYGTKSITNNNGLIQDTNSHLFFHNVNNLSTLNLSSNQYYAPFSTKSESESADKKTEETAEEESATEAEAEAETEISEVDELKGKVKELNEKLLRSLAEQENTRRIAKRDIESARNFAITSFAKSLLDTSDNLTRAMEAVPEEDLKTSKIIQNLHEGIQMTNDGLNKAFEKHGLKQFGVKGEKFDPNMHEALMQYPDESMEPGTLGQVMKVGFELNGRVIRSAEVGVIKKA